MNTQRPTTPLREDSRRYALQVAKHEFGHYIVGAALGFETGDVTIELMHRPLQTGHRGEATITLNVDLQDTRSVPDHLARRVQVLFAGSLAEALGNGTGVIGGEAALQHLRDGGKSDFDKSRELLNILRCIKHGAAHDDDQANIQLKAISDELWNKAADLVQTEHKLIEGFATNLAQKIQAFNDPKTLSASEIRATKGWRDRFWMQSIAVLGSHVPGTRSYGPQLTTASLDAGGDRPFPTTQHAASAGLPSVSEAPNRPISVTPGWASKGDK